MPVTSSLLLSRMRTGISCSIKWRRYFTSSKVCSGALVLALLIQLFALPPGPPVGSTRFPIVTAARDDPQIPALHDGLQRVEAILRGWHVFGIKADQILSPQFAQNIGECAIE